MSKRYKVLITGSSGMLGIDLCQELNSGYDVIGLDLSRRLKPKTQNSRAGFNLLYVKGDITDRKGVAAIIQKVSPDFVIHCAAWTDVDGCELDSKKAYKVNSEGARNVALGCKASGAALIYISTDFVFNGKKRRPYKETDRTDPLSVYGDSKLKGESFVKKALNNHYILRTSWLYGACGKNFVDTIIAKGKTEKCLRVVRDQVGSPTSTKSLARAIHHLLDKLTMGDKLSMACRGAYHLSNSGSVSWYNYAREILRLVKSKTEVLPITSEELARPARRPAMSVMDNSKFSKFTGYRMPDWKIALKEYLSKCHCEGRRPEAI
ncbi:MAG: dTDP-4-dehydrorhamnose reductase [Candidatus Omnitrophica bacterium]|nr:dTDP-4-dehydrorhamnose reductase [Candidatus Omnitrophota bacterium]